MTRSRSRATTSIFLVFAFLFGSTAIAVSAHAAAPPAADYVVNTTADHPDTDPGDNVCFTGNFIGESETPECTLRAAIQETDADFGTQTIAVSGGLGVSTLSTSAATASQPGTEDASDQNSDLDITGDLTLICFNATNDPFGPCSVDAARRGRAFDIYNSSTVTFDTTSTTQGPDAGWDIFNGLPVGNDGINGGGIRIVDDAATLILHNSTVGDFEGGGNGNITGAVQTNTGTGGCNTSTNSTCDYQAGDGGGIYVGGDDVNVNLDNAAVNYNSSGGTDQQDANCSVYYSCAFTGGDGGGIALEGARDHITGTTPSGFFGVVGNTTVGSGTTVAPSPCPDGCAPNTYTAGDGAGIFNEGVDATVEMTNVILGDNEAGSGFGGGIDNVGDNATFAFHDSYIGINGEDVHGNHAGYGGGIANNPANYGNDEVGILENASNVHMTFDNTSISSNSATQGGGIFNTGELFVTMTNGSVIGGPASTDGNSASDAASGGSGGIGGLGEGGGIFNGPFGESSGGSLTLTNVLIQNNTASNVGGGIYNLFGDVHMAGSSIIGNSSTLDGGGIWNGGQFGSTGSETDVINNTIANNSAGGRGGGTFNASFGEASFKNMTIATNSAQGNTGGPRRPARGPRRAPSVSETAGDNLYNDALAQDEGGFHTFVLQMDIITDGPTDNCQGAFFSATHNIDSDGTCGLNDAGDLVADPQLGTLGTHDGGPTPVFDLLPSSLAIDHGNADPSVCPATDQTGKNRPLDGDGDGSAICDIGAYEAPTFVSRGGGGGGGGGEPTPTPSNSGSPSPSESQTGVECGPRSPSPSPTTSATSSATASVTPLPTCTTPTPTATTPTAADSEITLGFRQTNGPHAFTMRVSTVNGVFYGNVTSSSSNCVAGRRVRLLRLRHGVKKFAARTNTNSSGHFRFRRKRAHGRFYARVKKKKDAQGNVICNPASSPTIKV